LRVDGAYYQMKKKALLLIAHGSRRRASNDEIARLAERLRRKAGGRYHCVRHAFLELAEPSIGDGIQQCVDAGAGEVYALPYFLAAGTHIVQDIPAEIAAKQKECPAVKIHLCGYLGQAGEPVADLLLQIAGKQASG